MYTNRLTDYSVLMTLSAGFGVAVAQFAPGADTAANLASIRQLATTAAARGAAIVVLPEYSSFFVHPMDARFLGAAEPLDGPFVESLVALAAELGIHVVAGMAETTSVGDRFGNAVVAISPTEGLVAAYRKLHLYDAFGAVESDWVQPGEIEEPETFVVNGVTVGLETCYDIRFPEVTRRLVEAGADLVLVPAEWVRGPLKEHHWRTLVTARAIENTIYVAAAGQTLPVGIGSSLIVDPMGVELAALGELQDVAVAWLDPARIANVRAKNPSLAMRRFGVHPL
jgi:predicted amidohydrolase